MFDLRFQVLDFNLLRFDRFDQQGRQLGIVHALNLLGLWITKDRFRNDLIDIATNSKTLVGRLNWMMIGWRTTSGRASQQSYEVVESRNAELSETQRSKFRTAFSEGIARHFTARADG